MIAVGRIAGDVAGHGAQLLSPDGSRLATGRTGSNTLQLWDTTTGELLLVLPGQGQSETQQVAFSRDGNLLVARQQGEGTRLFDVTQLPHKTGAATRVAIPDSGAQNADAIHGNDH
jgi:WD40 repeat protein